MAEWLPLLSLFIAFMAYQRTDGEANKAIPKENNINNTNDNNV